MTGIEDDQLPGFVGQMNEARTKAAFYPPMKRKAESMMNKKPGDCPVVVERIIRG